MGRIVPEPQIGSLGGTLVWALVIIIVVVFLFTTGIGPLLIVLAAGALIAAGVWVLGQRIIFRLKRGK